MPVVSHQTIRLSKGRHSSPESGACVMELASMLAGEQFTDHPRSVSRVVGAFLRCYNDMLDDTRRQDLYEYAAKVVGSARAAARLAGVDQDTGEEARQRSVFVEREDVCDVLVGTDEDNASGATVHTAQIEDVGAVRVWTEHLLVVDQAELALSRQQYRRHLGHRELAMALLKDSAHVDGAVGFRAGRRETFDRRRG
jgi:hypothetical protein